MVLYTGTKRKAGEKISGALEKRLTHMPFTHAFTGSNPVQVTNFIGMWFNGRASVSKTVDAGSIPAIPAM